MAKEPISSADQAVEFLMSLVRDDPRPYSARALLAQHPVRALLTRIGDPHIDLPVVHIAGSKGKGSTAHYLEAILQATGLTTGLFTSPHLQRWSERYRIDGTETSSSTFAALFARLQPHVCDLIARDAACAPSFFDVLTAAAFMLFAEQRVDCAIIETGIGGRSDATNVVQPMLSCISSVELEHTDKLGNTIAAIAAQKAGIIKAGVPVIIGLLAAEAESVIRNCAAEHDAPLSALGQDIGFSTDAAPDGGLGICVTEDQHAYRAEMAAPASAYSAHNAALAIACARRIYPHNDALLRRSVARAVPATRPPGRMEVVAKSPWIIIDGAHTPASSLALCELLNGLPAHKLHLIVSLSGAKNASAIFAPLLADAHRVIVTNADPSRSMDSARVAADLIAGGYPASQLRTVQDPRQAVLDVRASLADDDLLCITGSMYMAGVAREVLVDGVRAPEQTP